MVSIGLLQKLFNSTGQTVWADRRLQPRTADTVRVQATKDQKNRALVEQLDFSRRRVGSKEGGKDVDGERAGMGARDRENGARRTRDTVSGSWTHWDKDTKAVPMGIGTE